MNPPYHWDKGPAVEESRERPRAGPEGRGIKPRMSCLYFKAPENIMEPLLNTYNMAGMMLSDSLSESTLQMYYYLHLMEEETEVQR